MLDPFGCQIRPRRLGKETVKRPKIAVKQATEGQRATSARKFAPRLPAVVDDGEIDDEWCE